MNAAAEETPLTKAYPDFGAHFTLRGAEIAPKRDQMDRSDDNAT